MVAGGYSNIPHPQTHVTAFDKDYPVRIMDLRSLSKQNVPIKNDDESIAFHFNKFHSDFWKNSKPKIQQCYMVQFVEKTSTQHII